VDSGSRTYPATSLLLGPALALAWMVIQGAAITHLRGSQLPARQQDLVGPTEPESNGADAFAPACYPSTFTDADMDGAKDLLAHGDQQADERLGVLVYVWNGEAPVDKASLTNAS
jgi:hypothetical protein